MTSIAIIRKSSIVDRDQWLDKQINMLNAKFLKLPKDNRGPFTISDNVISSTKRKTLRNKSGN